MKKSWLWLGIVIIVLIAGIYLVRNTQNKTIVRLEWLHQAQFSGFYVAEQKGFYEERGIDISIEPGGVNFPAIQMVAGGSEQFGLAEADQILLAREKGVPIVALAIIYQKSPVVWFSLNDSGIEGPKDFIGKKVGTKPDLMAIYNNMLENAEVDKSKIKEVPVQFDLTPLLTGEIDVWPGFVINEPILAEEKGFGVNIIWPSDYNVDFYSMTLFTTEKMIKQNPELVKDFVEATLEGWEYAYNNPNEAAKFALLYSDQLKEEHEIKMMDASLELIKPDDKPIGYMDKEILEDMQQLLLDNGFMENSINIDEAFTNQFLR